MELANNVKIIHTDFYNSKLRFDHSNFNFWLIHMLFS